MWSVIPKFVAIISLATLPALSFVILPDAAVFSQPAASSERLGPQTSSFESASDPLPVVIWHGLGDSADADGIASIADLIEELHPGIYVHIISVGEISGDRQASWFGNVTAQLEGICDQLANDPILSTAPAIDAIGFSQGGQFLRAYQQRCAHWAPSIRNLITFGSQHNGIAEFKKCDGFSDFFCQAANALLKGSVVWSDYVQSRLVPAQYYRDNKDYDNYLEHSNFLADVNNERAVKNTTYAKNLAKLEKFVMLVFEDDTTVIPKESGWFAEVEVDGDNNTRNITKLQDRKIYTEDWLGLKALDAKGGLVFGSLEGGHMQYTDKQWKKIFKKYLGPIESDESTSWRDLDVEL